MPSKKYGNQKPPYITVLLVDDDPGIRLSCGMILKRAGFLVVDAACADQALSIWDRAPRPFDVLVTDYNMPGRNGVELAELLFARKPDLGVVLISGMCSEELTLPYGISFLQKPFSPMNLVESIRVSLQLGSSPLCRR